jgi:hypothetical protein
MEKHVKTAHNLRMCNLCIENKGVFPSEQKIYSQEAYDRHLKSPDTEGGEGHPNCEFCRVRYYDKNAIFQHLKKEHETCFICVREGIQYQYFKNYFSLSKHFGNVHHICNVSECLQKKFVVFAHEIDLHAHMRSIHPHLPV